MKFNARQESIPALQFARRTPKLLDRRATRWKADIKYDYSTSTHFVNTKLLCNLIQLQDQTQTKRKKTQI